MVLTSLDNRYRIRAIDGYNFVVEEYGIIQKGKGEGKEYIISAHYFRTLQQAWNHLTDRGIAGFFQDAESIEGLLDRIEELKDLLDQFIGGMNGKSIS